MISYIFVILLLSLILFWFENRGHHEIALIVCKNICRQINVQLLDDTIVLTRIRLKRKPSGQITVQRTYRFEFTENGEERRSGTLLFIGKRLELIEMQNYFMEITPELFRYTR